MTGSSATTFRFVGMVRLCFFFSFPRPTLAPGRLADRHHLRDLVVHPRIASSYLEGCNFLTASGEHPGRCDGPPACLLLWGPEAQANFVPLGASWVASGHSWALHGAFSLMASCCVSSRLLALVASPLQRDLLLPARSRCS